MQTPIDALLSFAGHSAFGTMTALGMTPARRGLDEGEREDLKMIFGSSLNLDKIRIQEGPSWIFTATKAGAFVIGNTIHVPGKLAPHVLAHEAMHVWQHQNGGTDYLSESLWAQWTKPGGGYSYSDDLKAGLGFSDLSPEQQGKLVETLYFHWPRIREAERVVARYRIDPDTGAELLVKIAGVSARAQLEAGFIDITEIRDEIKAMLA